MGAREG